MGDVPWSRPVKANGIDLLDTFSGRGSQPQSPVRTSSFVPRSCAFMFCSLTSPLDESRGFFLTEKTFCFDGPASIIYMLKSRGRPKSYVSSADISTIRRNFCVVCSRQPDGTDFQKQTVSPLVIGMTSDCIVGQLICSVKADERVPEPTGSYLPDKSGSFTALSRSLNTITQVATYRSASMLQASTNRNTFSSKPRSVTA